MVTLDVFLKLHPLAVSVSTIKVWEITGIYLYST